MTGLYIALGFVAFIGVASLKVILPALSEKYPAISPILGIVVAIGLGLVFYSNGLHIGLYCCVAYGLY